MWLPYCEKIVSPNHGGPRTDTLYIVYHGTAGYYAGDVSWLCNPDSRASSHLVIATDGEATQLVDLDLAAWHVRNKDKQGRRIIYEGHSNINYHSVGIEHSNRHVGIDPYPDAQMVASVRASVDIIKHYNVPKVKLVGHEVVDPGHHFDPGVLFPFEWLRRAVIIAMNEQDQNPSDWAKAAWEKAKRLGVTDGTDPHRAATREEVILLLDRLNLIKETGE